MENAMDTEKGLKFYIQECQQKDKEIEQLKKEKEWLLHEHACTTRDTFDSIPYTQEQIEKNMQQALKE